VHFYASLNTTLGETGDVLLAELAIPALAAGAGQSFFHVVTVPSALPPGRYFVGWLMDGAGVITESVETNNAVVFSSLRRLTVAPLGSEVAILSAQRSADGLSAVITFRTKPGFLYRVQRSSDLIQWTDRFTSIPGSAFTAPITRSDPLGWPLGSPVPRAWYYRVREE
jgi:hypothetical protein